MGTQYFLLKIRNSAVAVVVRWLTNPTSICEDLGSIPGLAQWVKDPGIAMSCGVGCRRGLDPALLWLWCRPAAAAPIQPLAWELPYASSVALKGKKQNNNNNNNNNNP